MLIETSHNELTHNILGCAMRVHTALGNGFPEIIYQKSLALEFEGQGLPFVREVHLPVYYLNTEVGARRVDFLIDNTVLIELKAVTEITPLHHAQIINYLKAYRLEIGLLLNFGQLSLTYKRFLRN